MSRQHPSTPPLSLIQQWKEEWESFTHVGNMPTGSNLLDYIAIQAAHWGADQVLDTLSEMELKRLFWQESQKACDGYSEVADSCRRTMERLQKLEAHP